MTERLLFTGTSHVTGGSNGAARSADGHLDIKLPASHLAAEQLFAATWSPSVPGVLDTPRGTTGGDGADDKRSYPR
jgi:lipoyl-dependent peroxiredoxin